MEVILYILSILTLSISFECLTHASFIPQFWHKLIYERKKKWYNQRKKNHFKHKTFFLHLIRLSSCPHVSVLSCGYHDINTVDLISTPYWHLKHFKVHIWNSSKFIETFDQL